MRKQPDRLLVGLVAGTAAVTAWFASGLTTSRAGVVAAWIAIAAIHICLTGVARSTAGMPGLLRPTRRFWRAVAAAGIIYLVGDLAQIVAAFHGPLSGTAATGGPIQVILLAVGSAWLMLTLLTVPVGFGSRPERTRFWMDVATVMVAAAVVGWYLVVPGRGGLPDMAAPVLAGPVILLLCVFVVAKLVMSGTAPFTQLCGLIATSGAAVKSGADAIGRDGLTDRQLHWFLACTIASHALLAIALRVNQIQLAGTPGILTPRRRKPYSLLPYGAIAVTYLLLTVAVLRGEPVTTAIALTGAAASTLLVVLRQQTAFRDNARLLGELDSLAARLRHHAFHDGLTGLPNRSLYAERLDAMLAADQRVAVMLVDLDDFKEVNDECGHAAGDTVLREVARRLRACVRESDTVARIGGDEFAVLLGSPSDAEEIAARIVRTVEGPVAVEGGRSAHVGASVGIAISTALTKDGDSLLREADHAMYAVKREGKGSYALAPYV